MIKKAITINRGAIEGFLMMLKDKIKGNKRLFAVIGLSLIVLVCAAIAFLVYYDNAVEKSLVSYSKIQDELQYSDGSDEAKLKAATDILNLKKKSRFGYVAKNGNYIAAGLFFQAKKYETALSNYEKFASDNKKSFLAPLAYLQQGVCLEYLGNYDKALEVYKSLEGKFSDSEFADRIFYDVARMFAKKGDIAKSKEYFEKVKIKYPDSQYSVFAAQRLMLLEVSK